MNLGQPLPCVENNNQIIQHPAQANAARNRRELVCAALGLGSCSGDALLKALNRLAEKNMCFGVHVRACVAACKYAQTLNNGPYALCPKYGSTRAEAEAGLAAARCLTDKLTPSLTTPYRYGFTPDEVEAGLAAARRLMASPYERYRHLLACHIYEAKDAAAAERRRLQQQ